MECLQEKRTLLNNILFRKIYWIGLILRKNYLHDFIEGQMMEVKGVRRYELKEKAEDRKRWKQQFITWTVGKNTSYFPRVQGSDIKQHT